MLTYQPKGSMCMACQYATRNCSTLPFKTFPQMQQQGATIIVRCTKFRTSNQMFG